MWLRRSNTSLKKRLIIGFSVLGVCLVINASAYYCVASRYLERYRGAEKIESCCPPSMPIVESERLVAFREAVKGADWQTFALEETFWSEVLTHLGFSPDMEGMAQFLSSQLPPFKYWDLRAMALPIVGIETREKTYLCSDDGQFHLNADGSVGLLFLSDKVARDKTVHYFHITDKGLTMGALLQLPAERRSEMAKHLDLIPKPEI